METSESGLTKDREGGQAAAFEVRWPHAPLHRLGDAGIYFVTAGTYLKRHHFTGRDRLNRLQSNLLDVACAFGWQLEAWAVFSNHYHFVGRSPNEGARSLSRMLGHLHESTAKWIDALDNAPGRQVWFNYRETVLSYQRSYLARLRYTHENAVKHGLVPVANQYPWCSAAWFERTATAAQVKTIYGFKIDRLNVYDEYNVHSDW